MEKKIFKRFLASFLALILIFLCGCFPSAFAAATDTREVAVAVGDALAEMGGLDGGWSLAVMSYFSANGISLDSYGNTGEDLTRVIMKYYEEYYNEEVASLGGAVLSISDYIANAISGTALGISRIVGAVDGAFNLLIKAPLAVQLQGFLDWWNKKFNPSGSVETTETVEIIPKSSVTMLEVPLYGGGSFYISLYSDGSFLTGLGTVLKTDVSLGDVLFSSGSSEPATVYFSGVRFSRTFVSNGIYSVTCYDSESSGVISRFTVYSADVTNSYDNFPVYLAGTNKGVLLLCSNTQVNYRNRFKFGSAVEGFNFVPYSYFYSSSVQFNSSGLSVLTMSQSSDGRLSYGPSGSSAGTIIQSGETISIPVIAPSIEGSAVSFSPLDTVADLAGKALAIVGDAMGDAADTVLELPSTVGELIPDIELFDDLEINWADDTPVTLTPSPSPVPDLPVTIVPTSLPSPWPVSPDQFAVVTSDGRTALVDITDTIKGWTESLTGIYQSYVDLLGSVFGFLPEEIQVLFKWSMAALIFTGIFKRWWWDHH